MNQSEVEHDPGRSNSSAEDDTHQGVDRSRAEIAQLPQSDQERKESDSDLPSRYSSHR